jgi:hypothetical protein
MRLAIEHRRCGRRVMGWRLDHGKRNAENAHTADNDAANGGPADNEDIPGN